MDKVTMKFTSNGEEIKIDIPKLEHGCDEQLLKTIQEFLGMVTNCQLFTIETADRKPRRKNTKE